MIGWANEEWDWLMDWWTDRLMHWWIDGLWLLLFCLLCLLLFLESVMVSNPGRLGFGYQKVEVELGLSSTLNEDGWCKTYFFPGALKSYDFSMKMGPTRFSVKMGPTRWRSFCSLYLCENINLSSQNLLECWILYGSMIFCQNGCWILSIRVIKGKSGILDTIQFW